MKTHFVLCINDGGYPESLEKRKFYEVIEDPNALKEAMLRVIDESGEDYLYSKDYFVEIPLPQTIEKLIAA